MTDLSAAPGHVRLIRGLSAQSSIEAALQWVAATAVAAIDGATAASITVRKDDHFETRAPTSDVPVLMDALQYEFGGPCVDAILHQAVVHVEDLRGDARWLEFADAALQRSAVRSMLSYRLGLDHAETVGALNLYAHESHAFDASTVQWGELFSAYVGTALAVISAREKITNLRIALDTSRDIGVAMGILMARYLITRDQAFDLLRTVSQSTHRKLRDLAADVVETGDLLRPGGAALGPPQAATTTPAPGVAERKRSA